MKDCKNQELHVGDKVLFTHGLLQAKQWHTDILLYEGTIVRIEKDFTFVAWSYELHTARPFDSESLLKLPYYEELNDDVKKTITLYLLLGGYTLPSEILWNFTWSEDDS
jgi:hypothetical protein